MAFRSNGGHIAGEDISAFVDEELSSWESARVAAHLQTCDECRSLADDMRATQTLVRELPVVRAPREFTLGPEFDVAPGRQQTNAALKRPWFNFMPAVAMSAALLLILVFADLSSLGSGSENSGSSGTSAAGRNVEDAAKAASESQPQPAQAQPVAPRSGQPVPGSGGANQQGFGPTPIANAAGAPATAPQPGTQVPLLAPAPSTPAGGVLIPPPPAVNTAGRVPTPTGNAVIADADEARGEDGGGIGVLRILEIVAAVVLAGSLVGLYWQKRAHDEA